MLNARDAMPDGGEMTIKTANIRINEDYLAERTEDLEPGRYVMLAISDTGQGIAPEILRDVFKAFSPSILHQVACRLRLAYSGWELDSSS